MNTLLTPFPHQKTHLEPPNEANEAGVDWGWGLGLVEEEEEEVEAVGACLIPPLPTTYYLLVVS